MYSLLIWRFYDKKKIMLNSKIRNYLWQAQDDAYRNLRRLKDEAGDDVFGQTRLKNAVAVQPKVVKCIDERVTLDQPALGLAGSGVLLSDGDFAVVSQKLKAAGVKLATYHEHCGACSLFCAEWAKTTGQNRNAIEVARESATRLQSCFDDNDEVRLAGYSDQCHLKMTGHPELHHARAIAVDFNGRFCPQTLNFPDTFLISAAYHPSAIYTAKEIVIALSIALGDHGFGEESFASQPVAIVCVGSAKQLDDYKTVVSQATKKYQSFITLLGLAIS